MSGPRIFEGLPTILPVISQSHAVGGAGLVPATPRGMRAPSPPASSLALGPVLRALLLGGALSLIACVAACFDEGGARQQDGCFIGGCSSQLCSDQGGVGSTCEWLEEYACYRTATCERQPDGACGWTPTPELTACLEAN